jgi:predicted O-methyltransferase YrrM
MISGIKKKILKNLFYKKYFKKQLDKNEKIFKILRFNLNKVKKILKNSGYSYDDENLSWHYHIFAGFSSKKKKKILEIGTHDGKFANFLSKIFPNSKIITCDLDDKNFFFQNTYNRENKNFLKNFLIYRKKNLSCKNIKFIKMDSFNLLNKFKFQNFDLIWVDGNHLGPQVQFDIFQSIKLLKNNGYMLVDDVIKKKFKHEYGSDESYLTLKFLERVHDFKSKYIFKRIWYKNINQEKFISITKI